MSSEFLTRQRQRLRAEVIDAAATAVVQRGWRGLRMGTIAAQVGVSRQTIYNEFTTKGGLAQALAGTALDQVLDQVDAALDTAEDLSAGWTLATRIALEAAAEDQLLKTLLSAESIQEFLPLFTTESGLITRGRTRVTDAVCRRWPDLDRDRVEIAAEAAVRLAISHVLMPMHPAEDIAQQAGWLLTGCLNTPVPASAAPGAAGLRSNRTGSPRRVRAASEGRGVADELQDRVGCARVSPIDHEH